MAPVTTELKVAVKVAGEAGLDKLSRSLINIGKQSSASSNQLRQISAELRRVQGNSTNSVASLRNYRNAWRDIAEQVEIGSKEFREATAEAARLDSQLEKTQKRRQGGGRLQAGVQIAGTVAASGVFGGPEGALGAGIGAFFGPQGAVVGGAIGAQLKQLREAASAAAEYSANLEKLRIALQGVTTSQDQYQVALEFINQTTKDFAIPQEIVTRQFTRLQASVQGAGGSLEDTKTAFNGIVAAVRATGGSLADVDAALTATAQVFSKGKVSAEELRQQIGERLPGAFTLFAQSAGLSTQELDKALENGEVSLQDFQTFAEALFERYGQTAQIIADGPESAGDRLQVALSNLSESVGTLLEPIGAAFQETFTKIIEWVDAAARALAAFYGQGREGLQNRVNELVATDARLRKRLESSILPPRYRREIENMLKKNTANLLAARDELSILLEESERDIQRPSEAAGLPPTVRTPRGGSGTRTGRGVDPMKALQREFEKAFNTLSQQYQQAARTKIAQDVLTKEFEIQKAITEGNTFQAERLRLEQQLIPLQELKNALALQEKGFAKAIEEERQKGVDVSKAEAQLLETRVKLVEAEAALGKVQLAQANERVAINRRENEYLKDFYDTENKIAVLLGEMTQKEYESLKITQQVADFRQKYDYLVKAGTIEAERYNQIIARLPELLRNGIKEIFDFKKSMKELIEAAGKLGENLEKYAVEATTKLADTFADFVATGKADFADFTRSVLEDLARIFARAALFKGLSLIPGVGNFLGLTGSANGNVFAKNKIVPFAYGGIVNKPTIFPMANGAGLMGEAGPEAIMPLRRNAKGRLGVEASGGVGNVVVNVDASGSSVQGDGASANQLGKAIGIAVQQELVKQKRPGGLLA